MQEEEPLDTIAEEKVRGARFRYFPIPASHFIWLSFAKIIAG
jgi:hypothetical protein